MMRRAIALSFIASVCSAPLGAQQTPPEAPRADAQAPAAERPAAPAVVRTPREAFEAGVEYLLSVQNEDGSWGYFHSTRPYEVYLDNLSSHRAFRTATTALCVLALHGVSDTNERALEATRRGLNYLLTAEQPGRASGSTFYNTWAHTYAIETLAVLAQDERFADQKEEIARIAERELRTLDGLQNATGGWGYYDFSAQLAHPTGEESTSFNTAAGLIACHEAKKAGFTVDDSVMEMALGCLERLRLPSGAYIYGFGSRYSQTAGFNQVKGSLGRSQPCNLALLFYERPDITAAHLLESLDNLRKFHYIIEIGRGRQFPHEAWYSTAGYYYFFGHYYASRVIHEIDAARRKEFAEWLAGVMVQTQDPDGSWFDFPFYGYSREYGAAFAVMTLDHCLQEIEAEVEVEPANGE